MVIVFLFGCGDCMQHATGIVCDKKTKQPIDSVDVRKSITDISEYSDSTGFFNLTAISGGVTGCPLMAVMFSKKNYLPITKEVKYGDTIFLERATTNSQ